MATTTTTIKVTADTRDAQRALSGLQNSLAGLASVGAITALGTAFGRLSTTLVDMENKLRLVTAASQSSNQLFDLMAKTALSLGAPLEDVSNLFFRIANNTKDLNLTQTEQIRVTELMLKGFMSTGISAQEASGAVVQFGQALSAGVLRGEELNSILEQAPPIADAIAKSFGVTRGALKLLGEQGQISAAQVIEAIKAAGASIDQDFGSRISTVQNELNNLSTSFSLVFKRFDEVSGASQGAAGAIQRIAQSLENLSRDTEKIAQLTEAIKTAGRWVLWFAAAVGAAFVVKGAIAFIGALKVLGATIAGIASVFTGLFQLVRLMFNTPMRNALLKNLEELSPATSKLGVIVTALKNGWQIAGAAAAGFFATIMTFADPAIAKIKDLVNATSRLFGGSNVFETTTPGLSTVTEGLNTGSGPRGSIGTGRARDYAAMTAQQKERELAINKAIIDRGIELRKIMRDQEASLGLSRLTGVELEQQQAVNQANSQLIKEIKNAKGEILYTTGGLNAAEEQRLRTLVLQTAQNQLQTQVSRDLAAANQELAIYQGNALTMSQSQLAIEQQVARFKRENVGLVTAAMEAEVRATAAAQQRLSMQQEINAAFAQATGDLNTYRANMLNMTSDQLNVELKLADAQRKYGDLLTDELRTKIKSTEESAQQLEYLKQMKKGVEAALKPLTGAAAGANVAGQLGQLLPVDKAIADGKTLMNGLQELRNRDLINEQQYQDAKLAAHVRTMDAMHAATKQKYEQEQLVRIQALVGDKFGYESQKKMAQDAADFQMKTDLEKYAFGLEQAANMFSEAGKENKRAFEAAKAFNIANAVMNTYMAATKALATYPFPFGLIAAAGAVAAGMAQVSAIRSQTYSGRALGGPVMGNESYLVGERGPEIFTPATSGKITRNNQIDSAQPVTVNFNISTVDAGGFDSLLVQRRGLITSMIADAQLERGRRG